MTSLPIPRWLPNAISFVRVGLVPVWVWFAEGANRAFANGDDGGGLRLWAAAVLVAIGASDVLDGWLARRFSLQSRLGADVDAFADKLAQVVLTTYLSLRAGPAMPWIPYWFLGLLIARDAVLVLGCFAIWRRHGRVETGHAWHGKVASLLLFGVLLACSFALDERSMALLLWSTAAVVLFSTLGYVQKGVRQFRARPAG